MDSIQMMMTKNPQAIFRTTPRKHIKTLKWAARWISTQRPYYVKSDGLHWIPRTHAPKVLRPPHKDHGMCVIHYTHNHSNNSF